MLENFEGRMAVMWDDGDVARYGVIVENSNGSIGVAPVRARSTDTRCYDEGGAIYARDRHNVALRSCPPPFTLLCLSAYEHGCYAFADPDQRVVFSESDFRMLDVLDDGDKISEKDLSDILDHPWRDEKELSKAVAAPKRLSPMELMRRDLARSRGTQGRGHGYDGPDFG